LRAGNGLDVYDRGLFQGIIASLKRDVYKEQLTKAMLIPSHDRQAASVQDECELRVFVAGQPARQLPCRWLRVSK
jgi:hypothetical protein